MVSGRAASRFSQLLCHRLQVSPKDITLLSLVFHGSFACSFSCSHSSSHVPLANFFSLSSPPSLLSSLYPASSSLVSCFLVKGRSRWDLWPYTALTWHIMIPVFFSMCYLAMPQCKVEPKLTKQTCIDFYILQYQTLKRATHVEWFCLCFMLLPTFYKNRSFYRDEHVFPSFMTAICFNQLVNKHKYKNINC